MLLGGLIDRVAHGAILQGAAVAILIGGFWASPNWRAAAIPGLVIAALFAPLVVARLFWATTGSSGRRVGATSIMVRAFALTIGCAWASAFVLLLPSASADQRSVALAIVTLLIAENQRLAIQRAVAICYVQPICIGAAAGFAMSGTIWCIATALAIPLYGWWVVGQSGRTSAAVRRQVETSATVAAQRDTIHTLLVDLDEENSDVLWRTDLRGQLVEVYDADATQPAITEPLSAVFGDSLGRSSDGVRSVRAIMSARKPFRNRLVEITGQAEPKWWRLSGEPLFNTDGAFIGYRGVGSDVSGARNSESRIAYLANYDALTGFANRSNFQGCSSRQCMAAATDGRIRALLCLDLDGFKTVNDSLGHEGGDELLKQFAGRLTGAVPSGTLLARIGGDEFALWVPHTTPARIDAMAKELIKTVSAPFEIDGLKVEIGCSIGIALTPQHGSDPDTLLLRADLALYRAKSEGRGCAKIFEEIFETSLIDRRKLEGDIKLALARGEFTLHYQPLVDTQDGRVVCFEALIRWNSPERGLVSPGVFVPAAENAGLITAIGRYVLFEACRVAATWPQDVQVAVNVSPAQVRSSDFLQDVTMALKTSGLHPSRLQLEVTESVFLDGSGAASNILQTLRSRGVKIALDDFGTGYSSLNYLVDVPVDKIKIDRAFVRSLAESSTHQAIVDAILGLARKLSIRVTAEGVETKAQAIALRRRRCDDLQGFLFSKPRPASDVPLMIAEAPKIFRETIPTHVDSPLAIALAARRPDTGQAA